MDTQSLTLETKTWSQGGQSPSDPLTRRQSPADGLVLPPAAGSIGQA